MVIKLKSTNHLQIFCELMINSKVISISILGPDDSCQGDQPALMGWGSLLFAKWDWCQETDAHI